MPGNRHEAEGDRPEGQQDSRVQVFLLFTGILESSNP